MDNIAVTPRLDKRSVLRLAIAEDEARLRRAMADLTTVVKQRTDMAQHINRRPYPWLLGGFVVGLMLGMRAAKKG